MGPNTVQVVYLPANPSKAAVAGQLAYPVWGAATIAHMVIGGLFIAAFIPLSWPLIRGEFFETDTRRRSEPICEDFAGVG